jgi:hypothetical protein
MDVINKIQACIQKLEITGHQLALKYIKSQKNNKKDNVTQKEKMHSMADKLTHQTKPFKEVQYIPMLTTKVSITINGLSIHANCGK